MELIELFNAVNSLSNYISIDRSDEGVGIEKKIQPRRKIWQDSSKKITFPVPKLYSRVVMCYVMIYLFRAHMISNSNLLLQMYLLQFVWKY